ncbi:prepilin peptidase [Nicoliella spurrieriana]|uniref:Prepilin peptidase n=1 Tax=Nicoliella spurrieriana TaxID=2925830 RepID=A0A976X5A5_9LACO|nr:A24 family peptidase [Nicoliella spurrieriana]UQS86342.1 prepilin peptidase [Nicoliella spurrieriana]
MILILLFWVGAAFGSFFSLIIQRCQRAESIISPRSHCDNCQIPISRIDLIPIISFLILRGRCRNCKAKISKQLFINELLFGGLFLLQAQFWFAPLIFSSLIMMLILSIIDFQKQMVPTKLLIILLLNNLIYYFFIKNESILTLSLIVIIYLIVLWINKFYLKIGEGDIDIIFILLLILGINGIFISIIISTIFALISAIFILKANRIAFIPFLNCGYLICLIFM